MDYDIKALKLEEARRVKARRDLKYFLTLKWERYEQKPFLNNWHIDYLCKVLEHTLPTFAQNESLSAQAQERNAPEPQNPAQNITYFAPVPFASHFCAPTPFAPAHTNSNFSFFARGEGLELGQSAKSRSQIYCSPAQARGESTQSGRILEEKSWFSSAKGGSLLDINDRTFARRIRDFNPKANANEQIITRLMINMPPSYGKTEIIARTFIAWALGNDRKRKFIYISYSDELCRKINNQVRDLIKSPLWTQVFRQKAEFLQDNANEFVLKEGGGLFVTTLKSAITGFHAHQILIDDPIKVADMSSKVERNRVNANFKESVLSRLQDNKSNITILMQRLGDEDLCGFLLDRRNFAPEIIEKWQKIELKALQDVPQSYKIGSFCYERAANEPLFPARHNASELAQLRAQMGEDEFSTQYLQEPQTSEAGFFESVHFKIIPSYELGAHNEYIFVDYAISLDRAADNRAMVVLGVESLQGVEAYTIKDCLYGIWDEEESLKNLLELMLKFPKAQVFIESEGGGLILERLLQKEIIKINANLKAKGQNIITNLITSYAPSRKLPKIEKIKALKPYYNTGFLRFLHGARGLEQIKKELLHFNPAKPFRKDDCIDCIASALAHTEVRAPMPKKIEVQTLPVRKSHNTCVWNV